MSATRTREVAKRLFAQELREADHMFKEDDDEYAPSYLLMPSGGKANRVLVMGTLIEKNEDDGNFNVRVSDPTGPFLVYAGQFQPEAVDALRTIDAPSYVAVIGKPDTFETDDGDIISTLRPERIVEVDEETRDKWVAETAEDTIERLETEAGEVLESEENDYAQMADEQYGTERRDLAEDVVVALEDIQDDEE